MVSRKSAYVRLDLAKACSILTDMEQAMGLVSGWQLDGLWLSTEGTLLLPEHILQVLARV